MTNGEPRAQQVLKLRDLFLRMSHAPQNELEAITSRELLQLLQFAVSNSPWWADRLKNAIKSPHSLTELVQSLPRTPKSLIQRDFTEMQIKIPGANPRDYVLHKTSGSTGQPTQVRKLITSYFMTYDALTLMDWFWQQRDVTKRMGGFRIGEREVDDAEAAPPLTYLGNPPPQFSRSSLDRSPAELVDVLVQFKPSYVYTNAVTIRLLALEQLANPRDGIVLEQFLSVSDRVDDSLRELVDQAFGAKICDRYSSEEFGYIALQCPQHNHLHVLSPSVYVEIVDENGNPCPVGVPGKVLVTDLHSFAQPMLRYEIGDIAQWGEPCAAGISWPVIENIVGRERNFLDIDGQGKKLVTFVGADFLTIRALLDFQVIRFADSIVMIAAVTGDFTDADQATIIRSLQEIFHTSDPVHIVKSDEVSWRSSWKRHEFDQSTKQFDPSWTIEQILDTIDG